MLIPIESYDALRLLGLVQFLDPHGSIHRSVEDAHELSISSPSAICAKSVPQWLAYRVLQTV